MSGVLWQTDRWIATGDEYPKAAERSFVVAVLSFDGSARRLVRRHDLSEEAAVGLVLGLALVTPRFEAATCMNLPTSLSDAWALDRLYRRINYFFTEGGRLRRSTGYAVPYGTLRGVA